MVSEGGDPRSGQRRIVYSQESHRPSMTASRYETTSRIDATVENRRCSAGCRKSLYGVRRTGVAAMTMRLLQLS